MGNGVADQRTRQGEYSDRRPALQRYGIIIAVLSAWTLSVSGIGINTWFNAKTAAAQAADNRATIKERGAYISAIPFLQISFQEYKEDFKEHKKDFKDFRREQRSVNRRVNNKLDQLINLIPTLKVIHEENSG